MNQSGWLERLTGGKLAQTVGGQSAEVLVDFLDEAGGAVLWRWG